MLLFLAGCFSEPPVPPVPAQQATVSFLARAQTDPLADIVQKEGYRIDVPHQDFVFYEFIQRAPFSTVTLDVQPSSFDFLHIPSGIHARGKRTTSIVDLWNIHKKTFSGDVVHSVAYGGAPWFSGSALQRAPLIKQMGTYFHRLEEQDGLEVFPKASPYVFAAGGAANIKDVLEESTLGLSCSQMEQNIYWCILPKLDLRCVESTQKWIASLFTLNWSQATEGMYLGLVQNQNIRICLPSGCFDCDTHSCKRNGSSEGMNVSIGIDSWRICLEKNMDEDQQRTRVCLDQVSFSTQEMSLYVDDCRIP